ncbi:hypothetical protein KEHDKFFH_16535 [Marinobacter maroccanus]|uniref:Uncharacterized protein n=1 Tax=Marinobacter maroccanus TaxID=2055143 RepID=A0A2S5Z6Q0_9GAMM|nr:hypothetical protein [Marinobacter maroccanus]PPI83043.1 hypothetical protein KEHDKFFH_16535 [Marinobacter maroccanus]
MKKLRALLANLMVVTSSFTFADSIRGVTVGDHYSALDLYFTEGELDTSDDPMGKDYGFQVHRLEVEDAILFARSLPTGELYDINFAQLVPMNQADEFKDALCEKYAISPCEWDTTTLKTLTGKPLPQFQGMRTAGDTTITVGISQPRRSDQRGFVWAGADINKGHPKDLINKWKHEARLAEEEQNVKAAREISEKADRVEMKF